VGQEVLVNLQNIEQSWTDSSATPPPPRAGALSAQFAQVQGALMIMELADAAA
jgi:hypothetical protein